ncbi:MAG: ATP-dependent DNA helicase DinG [Treponema sp.]|nr:ATP-dependent DNA helicase DinG [Treponema sp.]
MEEGGAVAGGLPYYEKRQAQLDLTEMVVTAFNEEKIAAAEAGTGVGKSFAYLVPAVCFSLENKEKVIISTATINLQQQLFEKDIPMVAQALDKNIKAVLMKGRANYLCRRRLDDALKEPELGEEVVEMNRIAQWAEKSGTGSRTELPFMPHEGAWAKICSESDSCMNNACPWRERCFVTALRKEASDANIIVVNHHLLFADLAARFQGAGYESAVVLPPYRRLIIDEAHTIEKAATSFFSQEFSSTGIFALLGRLYHRRRQGRRGLLVKLLSDEAALDRLTTGMEKIRTCTDELENAAFQSCGIEGVLRLSPYGNGGGYESALFPGFRALAKSILAFTSTVRETTENFDEEEGGDPLMWELKIILRRLDAVAEICAAFPEYRSKQNEVLWLERKFHRSGRPTVTFTITPLDLAHILKSSLFSPNKTIVCVSATLAVNGDFGYWAARCGIGETENRQFVSGCFPSPFPYSRAVLLAAPADAPLPNEDGWQDFIDQAVAQLISVAGGSALVLFTSYQSLSSAWTAAQNVLQPLGIRCLKQGEDDRSRLLQSFLSDKSSVLFATDSFWEGVDAPGDTLKLVILCRLPFRTPGDPVFEARREAVEKNGGNPFMELSLPEAVMKFKQGFGRLIRRSSDSGVVAVLDSRLIKKQYGQLFLRSLPETRTSFTEFDSILRETERFLWG